MTLHRGQRPIRPNTTAKRKEDPMTERIHHYTGGRHPRASAVERGTAHAVRLAMISTYRRASALRADGRAAVSRRTELIDPRVEAAPDIPS